MNKKNLFKDIIMALFAVVAMVSLTACGSDDDDFDNGNTSTKNVLTINGRSYDNLPYAQFISRSDGTATFIFSSVRMVSDIDRNAPLTLLSVRIPSSSSGIPTGSFSTDADADFEVNRIISTQTCDLTGWSLNLTINVAQLGDKYIINFSSNDMHIFHSDDEVGNGESGSLTLHYEGKVEIINND